MKKLKSQKGFSIFEVLVALAIFSINIMALTGFWVSTKKVIDRAQAFGQQDTLSVTIIQDIKAQVEGSQMFFDNSISMENSALALENLSMRWNGLETVDKDQCPYCRGKLGFIIQTFSMPGDDMSYRGIYRTVIRYQHDDIDDVGKTTEFLFVSK